ncbi:MAG TPA: hypothetical protein VKB93_19890 [Thermoanaerobaculia bacterium]|nr:hypothetical protein [Thermoanaerobaculia bacterium]
MRVPAQLIAALILAACASSATTSVVSLVPRGSALLTGKEGELLLTQCRSAPEATTFWEPTRADIRELERRLPAYLARQTGRRPSDSIPFLRQYTGFVQHGRRYIYLNAFPEELVQSNHEMYVKLKAMNDRSLAGMPPYLGEADYWRRHSIMVCDGGNAFWGVEYDPLTKEFLNLTVNGEA